MDIDVFPFSEIPVAMRALRTALRTTGALDAAERSFIDTFARIVGVAPPAELPTIEARDVQIGATHARKRLVQLAALAVLLTRPMRVSSIDYLHALAAQLRTHDPVIDVIDALHAGRRRTARFLTLRRGMRAMLKEAFVAEGLLGPLRMLAALALRLTVNRDKLVRYQSLRLLPRGTLGRAYWDHMTARGFRFPGQRGGIADSVAYHDVLHVLANHGTDAAGEILQGSFQAGNRREDGYFFVQFVVLQFHQALRITPAAEPEVGHFDPAKVLWAIHRGASAPVDFTHQWDFWPWMALPLGEARGRLGVMPYASAAVAPGSSPAKRSAGIGRPYR